MYLSYTISHKILIFVILCKYSTKIIAIAKLSLHHSNINSVGWAELALIPTFTHPPPGKIATTEQSLAQLSLLFDFVANIPLFACWLNLIIPPEL